MPGRMPGRCALTFRGGELADVLAFSARAGLGLDAGETSAQESDGEVGRRFVQGDGGVPARRHARQYRASARAYSRVVEPLVGSERNETDFPTHILRTISFDSHAHGSSFMPLSSLA